MRTYVTAPELRELDRLHDEAGIGPEWQASERRAELRVFGATLTGSDAE